MGRQGGNENLKEARSVFSSTVGGVMTEEAGAITGDLEVATRAGAAGVEVLARYAEAEEWYTVEGSPIGPDGTGLRSPFQLRELHKRVLEHLKTPGQMVGYNEEPTSLLGFPATAGHE